MILISFCVVLKWSLLLSNCCYGYRTFLTILISSLASFIQTMLHWVKQLSSLLPLPLSLHIYIYSLVSSLSFQTRHGLSCFIVYLFPPLSFSVGPRVFLNCPLETSSVDMELWFINLWNHFIIPYLMGTIMAGIEVCIMIK